MQDWHKGFGPIHPYNAVELTGFISYGFNYWEGQALAGVIT